MTRITVSPPIGLRGELDVLTARPALDRQHIPRQAVTVTVDLTDVTFLDAAGLGAIVGLRNELIAAGGSLQITGASSRMTRIFALGGLAMIL
jgi:anti-sigma B factor antagonist